MVTYPGGRELSDFRKQKILKGIKQVAPQVKSVEAQFVHFVDSPKLSVEEEAQLKALLDYGEPFSGKPKGELFLVVPRLGTISPWSSKATDIAINSGLAKVSRIERGTAYYIDGAKKTDQAVIAKLLHDRMTETVLDNLDAANQLFGQARPKPFTTGDILTAGRKVLEHANQSMGLALSADEIDYLYDSYKKLGRNPTDVEMMMFAQVNSEHSRHKIFKADWTIDGRRQPKSLFGMIQNTYSRSKEGILSAYSDNAAVLAGPKIKRLITTASQPSYRYVDDNANIVIKVETHNHPTAISPFPGAATGVGGEIRDEAATGRGGKSKAGLTGYSVSNLQIPGAIQPWEKDYGKPDRISSALEIMVEAPIGGAGYANEFGRPNICGYWRTYEQSVNGLVYGYHKPIMLAGGVGSTSTQNVKKGSLKPGDKLLVIGGPAMLIGLGGGAASSLQTGHGEEELDFASVQRDNAEMERRTQEVIDRCAAQGKANPIITIGDVGAGGLSNALPEMLKDSGVGGQIELRDIPNADRGMSPMEIWCNEAQERYVIGISPANLDEFQKICERERCPMAVVGEVQADGQLIINDSQFGNRPVDIPLNLLFSNPPKLTKDIKNQEQKLPAFDYSKIDISDAVERVLRLPAVGSKKFLITIGDRTVGGLIARDQMVGPWQVPVSDVAVTASSFHSSTGEAMAIGERTPLATINSATAARMAVGEAITNIAAADVAKISDIKLSANWMAACGEVGQDQKLFEAVKAVGEEFCPAIGITIPVGKDSLSMRTKWEEKGRNKSVTAPVSLIIGAFVPVADTDRTLTPQAVKDDSVLILIDFGQGETRLGGSSLAQVYNQLGNDCPDIEPDALKKFFEVITKLKKQNKILAYHDRSDGGLLATTAEMSFAGRVGFDIDISDLPGSTIEKLFNEELGVVVQVTKKDVEAVLDSFGEHAYQIGQPTKNQAIIIRDHGKVVYKNTRARLEKIWAETSYLVQKLRDNPKLADQEYKTISDDKDPGLNVKESFRSSTRRYRTTPKVAILREQGVNGQVEMAAGFMDAGFEAVDVHLTDLSSGRVSLDDFKGLVACGGFSYGDVLGAGEGMAKSVLFNERFLRMFKNFFERSDTFSLGVCNGCQMFAALKGLIPGAGDWPRFVKNSSEQFEGRLVLTKIKDSPSVLLRGMAGWRLPIPTAHGEGRAEFSEPAMVKANLKNKLVTLQFVDNYGRATESYPANPNGSPLGIAGLTSTDGRATIVMPHPERVFLTKQLSWQPAGWSNYSPWFKLFQNARDFVS
ncbi:phosphoribosylformylglycinamidine synthase [Candidatus Saccharibacteria bacterium RIFCSPHIGHO2_12_FULL_47_16b]|nr:MAG: phosphoribosylformylglycinamidine synthase [Candidatus Saccharibacteria bacterium RIFCSPHIGHO2_12_FULL_47_16b]